MFKSETGGSSLCPGGLLLGQTVPQTRPPSLTAIACGGHPRNQSLLQRPCFQIRPHLELLAGHVTVGDAAQPRKGTVAPPYPPSKSPFPKTTPVLNLKGCFSPLSGVPHRKERMSNETCPRGHQALYGDICGSCDSGSSGHREDGGGRDAAQPPSVPVAAPQGRGERPWCVMWVSVSAHTGWSSREPGGHSWRAGRWLRSAARWLFPAALKQALLPSAFHSRRHDADRCGRSCGVSEKGQGRGHTPCLLCFSDTCGQLSTLPRLNVLSF